MRFRARLRILVRAHGWSAAAEGWSWSVGWRRVHTKVIATTLQLLGAEPVRTHQQVDRLIRRYRLSSRTARYRGVQPTHRSHVQRVAAGALTSTASTAVSAAAAHR